ncbi:putative triacylglycerol lipase [Medicago truncatula]|uniref:Putative triacylglycerol lipase n=1 Tax=Medicago truncatula TaxID=3880 RepID=A0A396GT46_MEDTR|nr:GDSL esterase/lipase EXL3-like [Medicago truncatula]RHN41945.1 putative triacylglycerol lipase [Medicago truncatula]
MMKLFTLIKYFYVCPFLVLFYPFDVTATFDEPPYKNHSFPAVIAFGDSILDTGNNNYLSTIVKADFKPYGRDFIGGKATGRFCNGKVPSDVFLEYLGIKEAMPPYLDPNLSTEDLLTGVCFASAGSGYDPLTIELGSVLSAEDQLEMFKEYIGKLKEAVGENRTAEIIANSMLIISMGTNDIAGTYYLLAPFRQLEYDIENYTSMLVSANSKFVEDLYLLGARRIGIFSLSPIGCVPLQRTIKGGLSRECVEILNEGALIYNAKLSTSILDLARKLPDSRLVYLENFSQLHDIIINHNDYGFENGDGSCCGIANIELGPLCSSFTLKVCNDTSQYVFWDSYHPTEKAYKILVKEILDKKLDEFV